jgi:hypothetical protein
MPAEDRDRLFEKALARHLRDAAAGGEGSACLDAETLAAYHEGSISADEVMQLRTHLASCSRCQEILAQVAATETVTESSILEDEHAVGASLLNNVAAPAEIPARVAKRPAKDARSNIALFPVGKTLLRWAAPAGAIAAAVLLFFGLRTFRAPSAKHSEPATEIAENRGDTSGAQNSYVVPSPPQSSSKLQDQELSRALSKELAQPAPRTRGESENLRDKADSLKDLYDEKQLVPAAPSAGPAPARNAPAAGIGGRISQSNEEKAQSPAKAKSQDLDSVVKGSKAPSASAQKLAEQRQDQSVQSQMSGAATGAPAYSPSAPPQPPPPPLQQNETVVVTEAVPQVATEAAGVAAPKKKESDLQMMSRNVISAAALAPSGMTAQSGNSIWRFGEHGAIAHSSDGGKTWKPQVVALDATLTNGSAPSKNVCWIAGTAGTLLRTTDGGKHWRLVITPIAGDLGGVLARDRKHATIWDGPRRLSYETSDGGKTWAKKPSE